MTNSYPLATSTWDDKELGAIQSVIDRDIFTMGESVAQFEKDFCEFTGSKYAVMVSSGSTANLVATAALFYTKNPFFDNFFLNDLYEAGPGESDFCELKFLFQVFQYPGLQ